MVDAELRQLLAGLQLCVIDCDSVISWADKKIREADAPPYWIIELSSSTRASRVDLQSLLRAQVGELEVSDKEFLGAMAVRFLDFSHPLKEILPLMYERFCLANQSDTPDETGMIYLIDDEFDWEPKRGTKTAREFLRPYLEDGRAIIRRLES